MHRQRGRTTADIGDHVLFFGDNRRTVVAIDVGPESWQCVFEEESELEGPFVDLLLRHLVLRSPDPVRRRYHAVSCNAQFCMAVFLYQAQGNAAEAQRWEWLGDFGMRWMSNGFDEQDTTIVPYLDHDHWTLFIVRRHATYHVGTALELHDNRYGDDFATLLHIAFATTLRLVPGQSEWWKVVCRGVTRMEWPGNASAWECGYAMCFMFWQYLCHRGVAPRREPPTPPGWVAKPGRYLQVWFLECLWRELCCRDQKYQPARMCTAEDDSIRSWEVSDLPIQPQQLAVPVGDGGCRVSDYGISNSLVDMRRLRDFCIQRPPNPSEEEEGARVGRLAREAETRRNNRQLLTTLLHRKAPAV